MAAATVTPAAVTLAVVALAVAGLASNLAARLPRLTSTPSCESKVAAGGQTASRGGPLCTWVSATRLGRVEKRPGKRNQRTMRSTNYSEISRPQCGVAEREALIIFADFCQNERSRCRGCLVLVPTLFDETEISDWLVF